MKKTTKNNIKKIVKKGVVSAQSGARVVAGNAYVLGRGIVRGVKQGIKDAQNFDKPTKRKS